MEIYRRWRGRVLDGNSITNKRIGDKNMNKEIKERIINQLKDEFYNNDNFNISDIERIVNEIPESDFTPKYVKKYINVDEDKLFNKNVSDIIDYLSLYEDCELQQLSNEYENKYFVFSKKIVETKDSVFNRLLIDTRNIYSKLLKNKYKLEELNKRKQEIQDKIAEINRQIEA